VRQGLQHIESPKHPPRDAVVQTVLVVDDSRLQRRILASYLAQMNLRVLEAAGGAEALAICRSQPVDMIISDWMMPGMDGLTFCQLFRGLGLDRYVYFILLTSRSEKADIAEGLDIGADDFLTKPISLDELRARINAAERLLRMQRELSEKNRLLATTLGQIQSLYDALDRDLQEARQLQQALVRERRKVMPGAEVNLLLRPCGHVGGDLVGFFPAGERAIGMFSIDVSGHGIASALLTARIAAHLLGGTPGQNLALQRDSQGRIVALDPAQIAHRLNAMMLSEMQTQHYFTCVLAIAQTDTGIVDYVQAGHPGPVLVSGGAARIIGDGGMPIGLFPDLMVSTSQVRMRPGDRLVVYSDGLTECPGPGRDMLGDEGLLAMIERNAALGGPAFLEALIWDLATHADSGEFPDDVSALVFDYRGGV
jgi:sigma-B regulation protein RsbU (phosphoserine phosphatase)